MQKKSEILDRESAWRIPVAIMSLIAVITVFISILTLNDINNDGDAAVLRSINELAGDVRLTSLIQAVGFALLVAPLVYLFRATAARSSVVRRQLIGLVVVAPLFLATSLVLNSLSTIDAAESFTAGEAKPSITVAEAQETCRTELRSLGAAEFQTEFGGEGEAAASARCEEKTLADDAAGNALRDAKFANIAIGFGLAGRFGLAVALLYTCLHAMRAGLLTRFWGALGMALGVAALLLIVQFVMIFFLFFAFLLFGLVPGGRPPAWAAGEAIPWPTPGQKAAAELGGEEDDDGDEGDPRGGGGDASGEGGQESGAPGEEPPPRRKRKQRD